MFSTVREQNDMKTSEQLNEEVQGLTDQIDQLLEVSEARGVNGYTLLGVTDGYSLLEQIHREIDAKRVKAEEDDRFDNSPCPMRERVEREGTYDWEGMVDRALRGVNMSDEQAVITHLENRALSAGLVGKARKGLNSK